MGKEQAFYAMTDRTRYIQRWSLMYNTQSENVAEHSFQTAVIAHGLAVIRSVRFPDAVPRVDPQLVLAKDLYHDISEVITGDLPTPVKYHDPQVRDAYKNFESLVADDLLHMLPEDLRGHYAPLFAESGDSEEEILVGKLVKAADRIAALVKCQSEMARGNTEFQEALETTRAKLEESMLPEVQVFLDEFLPAFSLSLDKLRSGLIV